MEYCRNTFSALKQSQSKAPKGFSFFVQHTSQCWVDRHVAFVHLIVSLAFVNVMDRIILKPSLFFFFSTCMAAYALLIHVPYTCNLARSMKMNSSFRSSLNYSAIFVVVDFDYFKKFK